jgi:hypothetical protein
LKTLEINIYNGGYDGGPQAPRAEGGKNSGWLDYERTEIDTELFSLSLSLSLTLSLFVFFFFLILSLSYSGPSSTAR